MSGETIAGALLTLGAIFLAGLAADLLGRRTPLPRVTLLLLIGVVVGPLGLDVFPASQAEWFPFVADLALLMVAFLLGGELTRPMLRRHGRAVLGLSLVVVAATAAIVAAGLLALGWPVPVALLLGAIATSTDPAAVSDVVREVRARGPVAKTLLGVVAVDDAWGIAAMSIALAVVLGMQSGGVAWETGLDGASEIAGGILLGIALGLPLAFLSGRVRAGEPTQAEALGAGPIGIAMLPQAGVAIGMALVASQRVPDVGGLILSATVAATVVFEIGGPVLTRAVLLRSDRP